MTTQPALPGLAFPAALLAQAIVLYRPLYGADVDSARVGVETMVDVYGSIEAALAELRRRAGQAGYTATDRLFRGEAAERF